MEVAGDMPLDWQPEAYTHVFARGFVYRSNLEGILFLAATDLYPEIEPIEMGSFDVRLESSMPLKVGECYDLEGVWVNDGLVVNKANLIAPPPMLTLLPPNLEESIEDSLGDREQSDNLSRDLDAQPWAEMLIGGVTEVSASTPPYMHLHVRFPTKAMEA